MRAGRRGDTWQGARGVRRRPSGRPSRRKIREESGAAAEQVRTEHGQSEPVQGVRWFPDKDRAKMGSEREASDHTGGSATIR